jgi:hypothetical protein
VSPVHLGELGLGIDGHGFIPQRLPLRVHHRWTCDRSTHNISDDPFTPDQTLR